MRSTGSTRRFATSGLIGAGLLGVLAFSSGLQAQELVEALAFGSRNLNCATESDPNTTYTMVFHGSADSLEYDEARGWGYEVLYPDPANRPHGDRAGYGRFGPFDDSPNNRAVFPDTCPEQLYDSFIGAKTFLQPCDEFLVGDRDAPCSEAIDPDGIIFRVDVPNGFYRFVGAVGSADNNHVSRILAEDGGEGLPVEIGPNHVVLVNNHDHAQYGAGNFAHFGFDGKQTPRGNGPLFTNMGAEGFPTPCAANSPVLEVTEGYIRIHQLQGNSNPGDAGAADPNGGNMVLLELWRFDEMPDVGSSDFVTLERAFPSHDVECRFPGDDVDVELTFTDVTSPTTIEETVPEGWTVVNDGGGTVTGDTITFQVDADGSVAYVVRSPDDCLSNTFTAAVTPSEGCVAEVSSTLCCVAPPCALQASGAPADMLIIGPIDLIDPADGQNVSSNGACNDADGMGNDFTNSDYLINADETLGESNLLVAEGDELEPDFGGLSRGAGVPFGANELINPAGSEGILTVWRADADADGLIDMNNLDNVGDPVDDYIVYALSYLQNRTGACLDVTLEVGSDDAVKLLLNGQLVHANAVCRGTPGYGAGDMVQATLAPGTNIVLIGVVERGGGTGVRLVVRDRDGQPINDGRVASSCVPPAEYPNFTAVIRSIVSDSEPGGSVEVTLSASNVSGETTIVETFPPELTVENNGGGVVQDNTITFTVTADGDVGYTLAYPDGECPFVSAQITGAVSFADGCGALSGDSRLGCAQPPCELDESVEAELFWAFYFGSRELPLCTNAQDEEYIGIVQVDPFSIAYYNLETQEIELGPGAFIEPEEREYGFEILYSDGNLIDDPNLPAPVHTARGGYEIFGPLDDSPNGRNKFPDECPEEIFDSFIGGKDFRTTCDAGVVGNPDDPCTEGGVAADGIIFRVDVPNGLYRFVAAVGDPDNVHAHRLIAEDGGFGPPQDGPGDNHVVLIENFDQAQQTIGEADAAEFGEGVFGRVGFAGRIPPIGDGTVPSPRFIDHDADGLPTTGCADSPTLEVTQGYIRFHSLQGNSNDGPGGPRDPNGGDLVTLEIWKVGDTGTPPVSLKPGDVNADGSLNIADPVAHLNSLFGGDSLPACYTVPGSDPVELTPAGLAILDFNGDGGANISDPVGALGSLFGGGDPHVLGEGCTEIAESDCASNCVE